MISVSMRRISAMLAGSGLLLCDGSAWADDTLSLSESFYALGWTDDPSVPPDAARRWRFSAGAGVINMPKFPGASGTKWEVVPAISANFDRFFIGANPDAASLLSLGAYLFRDSNWRVGVALTYDFIEPREEAEDERLRGLGDVDRTTRAEVFGVYTYQFVAARASVLTDIGGNDRGTVATLDVMGKFEPMPGLTLSAGPGFTWASNKYNRTYFGVSNEQSARSGLPAFTAGSGVNQWRFSVGALYRITKQWNVGASVVYGRLHGDASDSPITEKKNQFTSGVFFNYLF